MRANNITIETAAGVAGLPQDARFRGARNGSPLITNPARTSDCRAYQRRLRAAEMAAWEQTGGDYLLSDYVARDFAADVSDTGSLRLGCIATWRAGHD